MMTRKQLVSAVELFDSDAGEQTTVDLTSVKFAETIDTLVCPLCGQANSCLNQGSADIGRSCWCNDPEIHFPESLLSQIPPEKRRKACVCLRCAEKHQPPPLKS